MAAATGLVLAKFVAAEQQDRRVYPWQQRHGIDAVEVVVHAAATSGSGLSISRTAQSRPTW